jgi:hypothetical protein
MHTFITLLEVVIHVRRSGFDMNSHESNPWFPLQRSLCATGNLHLDSHFLGAKPGARSWRCNMCVGKMHTPRPIEQDAYATINYLPILRPLGLVKCSDIKRYLNRQGPAPY